MKILSKIFKSKKAETFEDKTDNDRTETKSYYGPQDISFTEYLIANGNGDLGDIASIRLYMKAMPLFNAITMRAEAYSNIPLRVYNTKTEQYVEDHPALELLDSPNADVSSMEFLEQVSSYYDITGNSYQMLTGRVEKPPLEIISVPSQNVTFGMGNKFVALSVPDVIYITNSGGGQTVFYAEETMSGIRFINSNRDLELWHMRTFNPLRSSSNFRGMSRARPIWLELEQYLSGNVTNLSMLKRGTRLSMAWVNNRGEELTDKQWNRMQEEAQKYSGDSNAGGTPVLDGMDVKTIQHTNRDMEFEKLQTSMFTRVSVNYKIPLALLLAETMTLNNLETALLQFFDLSALPLADRLNNELTRFIMPRFPNSEHLVLKYNENDITALRLRMIETAKSLSEINVSTINELRTLLGEDEIIGGDVILRPATLLPIGENGVSVDIPDEDIPSDDTGVKYVAESKLHIALREKGFSKDVIKSILDGLYI